MIVYALDIGGSAVKHALVDTQRKDGQFIRAFEPIQLKSRKFDDLKHQIIGSLFDVFADERSLDTIAISTTGGVDEKGVVLNAGHFDGYTNVSWEKILQEQSTRIKRVITVSDGKAATWAEYRALTTKATTFAHFVVGTGIGGGIVYNHKIFTGGGYAGYFGHIKVSLDQLIRCSCGNTGCVETLAAGPAIVRHYNELAQYNSDNINLQDIVTAAQNGDECGKRAFQLAGTYLGLAISSVMNTINPNVITIGGGVVLASGDIDIKGSSNVYLDAAVESATKHAHRRVSATTMIQKARHGNDAGMIGAALLADLNASSDK